MSRIIFDIETAGKDFDCLEPAVQEYLLNGQTPRENGRR